MCKESELCSFSRLRKKERERIFGEVILRDLVTFFKLHHCDILEMRIQLRNTPTYPTEMVSVLVSVRQASKPWLDFRVLDADVPQGFADFARWKMGGLMSQRDVLVPCYIDRCANFSH